MQTGARQSTSAGHTFAPADAFVLSAAGPVIVLKAPEGDASVAIIDVQAQDADAAVAAAWLAIGQTARKLRLASPQAARNGWEEQRSYDYETSPNEQLSVQALARRAGAAWLVVILQGSDATLEKRAAPIGKMLSSLRPKGYQRETFTGRKPLPLNAERIAALRDFVAQGMKQLEIPGVGFSLIDGNRVVFEGGAGVRALGKPELVDAHTLFMAASNTKAMTTLLLAQAVDAGRLQWDQVAHQAYAGFKLDDAKITEQVLIKHLVCACTGMPRQDLEWLFADSKAAPNSTFEQLAKMKPTSQFGEVFQYSNLMVSAAGYIAANAFAPGQELGKTYDKAMQDKLFTPLGMNDTTFDMARAQRGNHAQPHGDDLAGRTQVARMGINNKIPAARPAGGVWTSPHDLSRFVLMELAQGRNQQGKEIVSERNLAERYKPQVLTGEDSYYGMGLAISKRDGVTVVQHGGDLLGYHSDMIWLPEFGIGATILTNSDAGVMLRAPFLRKLLELVFEGKPEADERLRIAGQNRKLQAAKARELLTAPAAAGQAKLLASRYQTADLGQIQVKQAGGKLRFEFDGWGSEMASRTNDDGSQSFITIDPGIGGIEFVKGVGDAKGKRELILRDAQHEYRFKEVMSKP